jgi:hypothetical protein
MCSVKMEAAAAVLVDLPCICRSVCYLTPAVWDGLSFVSEGAVLCCAVEAQLVLLFHCTLQCLRAPCSKGCESITQHGALGNL